MAITVLTNAFLIDCTGKDPADGATVVIEGERIRDVIRSGKVGPLWHGSLASCGMAPWRAAAQSRE
jgi:hypothetical protein